jgi:hypothetical protein
MYNLPRAFGSNGTNRDDAAPTAGSFLSVGTLYGTALYGSTSGVGTVFAIIRDVTGFKSLHN